MNKILKFSLFISIFTLLFGCSLQNSGGFFENKLEEFEKKFKGRIQKLFLLHKKNLTKKFLELPLKIWITQYEQKNGQKVD